MKKIAFVLMIASVLIACPIPQRGEPQAPNDTEYCALGCAHLLKLPGRDGNPGCEEARVLELPGGELLTCEQFCVETQDKGRSLCPSKWLEAKSCSEIEELRLKCNISGE